MNNRKHPATKPDSVAVKAAGKINKNGGGSHIAIGLLYLSKNERTPMVSVQI